MSNQLSGTASSMKDLIRGLVFIGLFAVPFLTLYVENDFFFPFITGKNFAFRIIVEIVFALWAVLALYDKVYRPRFSWLLGTFGILTVVMLASSLLAQDVNTALWSNYERMDGFVTLIHVFMYFLVLGTMLRTPKAWSYFLHTSVTVAGFVALKGLSQLSTSAGVRVDSTLGNAAYMAIYMLFHVFILFYLFIQTRVIPYRVVYGLLSLMFIFVLLQTGTRGTSIGLVTGAVVTVAYIALFGVKHKQVQKYALGSFVVLIVAIGGFVVARDSAYIQETPALARIANIDLGDDLRIRSIIWGMSVEGIKERPILGWGQGNFNYVFNEQYDPRLYSQEQWFDRVHNIVFDWLIAGGILGFLAYLSIFTALAYYLIIRPLLRVDDSFTVLERGVLVGLIAGYFTHNLVVFDNIISYIFFGSILALIHSRVSKEIPSLMRFSLPTPIVTQIALPVLLLVGGVSVYLVNIPSMQAAGDIIVAFQEPDLTKRLAVFEVALARGSFAQQEIVEQLAQQAMSVARPDATVSEEVSKAFTKKAEEELLKMIERKPGDARLHVFLASYYRAVGEIAKAQEQVKLAREYSPNKQAIILQQGAIELSLSNNEAARDFFQTAFELDTTNVEAREYYVASLFYVKDIEMAEQITNDAPEDFKARLANSNFVVSAVNTAGALPYLAELYEVRTATNPTDAQNWASLAFIYHQIDEDAKAIEVLKRSETVVPSFAKMAQCISGNITAGREPQLGCQ